MPRLDKEYRLNHYGHGLKKCCRCNEIKDKKSFKRTNHALSSHCLSCNLRNHSPEYKVDFYGIGLKRCPFCDKIKDISSFSKKGKRHSSKCKSCHTQYCKQLSHNRKIERQNNGNYTEVENYSIDFWGKGLKKCRFCNVILLRSCFKTHSGKESRQICNKCYKPKRTRGKEYELHYYGYGTRKCTQCKKILPLDISHFYYNKKKDYWFPSCAECKGKKTKKWKEANRGRVKIYNDQYIANNLVYLKKWREENKDRLREEANMRYKNDSNVREKAKKKSKEWKEANREKTREQKRRAKKRNPLRYHLSQVIRQKLKRVGASKNGRSTFKDILTYSVKELRDHLESKFQPGMSWDNYGAGPDKWSIDHVVPDSWFTYKSVDDEGFKQSWALDNLQPMWFCENSSKSNRYSGSFDANA